jgi:hypothetical protein
MFDHTVHHIDRYSSTMTTFSNAWARVLASEWGVFLDEYGFVVHSEDA